MNPASAYPAISDLRARAKRRVPRSIWAFLEGGTGDDYSVQRNLDGFANITLLPRLLKGKFDPAIETTVFGQRYNAPFGVAPVGLSGAIWPQAECLLAVKSPASCNLGLGSRRGTSAGIDWM